MPVMNLAGDPATPEPAAVTTVAQYESTSAMLAATQSTSTANAAGIEGEFNASDIKLPYLNLTQKSSNEELLAFGLGAFIFDKAVKVGDTKNPVECTFLRLKKSYRQLLPQGSQEMPQNFETMADVRAAGLQLGSVKNGLFVGEQAFIQVAVKAPASATEDDLVRFPYEHNDGHYALAAYIVNSSAYGTVARPLITLTLPGQPLAAGLRLGKFELHSEKKTGPKGEYWVPKPLFKGLHNEEDAQFFGSLVH